MTLDGPREIHDRFRVNKGGRPSFSHRWVASALIAYRPGQPWDGIFCYPRAGSLERFEFGDPVHLRYADGPEFRFRNCSKAKRRNCYSSASICTSAWSDRTKRWKQSRTP